MKKLKHHAKLRAEAQAKAEQDKKSLDKKTSEQLAAIEKIKQEELETARKEAKQAEKLKN